MKDYNHRTPEISEREIERKYSKLEIKPAAPNRTNCYTCNTCGYVTKTIDRNYGVTPMFLSCPCCGNQSTSCMYRDLHPDKEPEYEWFVPTLKELGKYKKNPAMLDHIFSGGLDYRKIR
jgi:hypothetical protein